MQTLYLLQRKQLELAKGCEESPIEGGRDGYRGHRKPRQMLEQSRYAKQCAVCPWIRSIMLQARVGYVTLCDGERLEEKTGGMMSVTGSWANR